jgi:hypothetical protein
MSVRRNVTPRRNSHNVGYGKPPQSCQFKPGESGNPRGRRKGTKNEATILRDLLNRKVEVREAGKARKITVLEAILIRFTEDALKGNTKTAAFLFNRYTSGNTTDPETEEIIAGDRAILDEFVKRVRRQSSDGRKRA